MLDFFDDSDTSNFASCDSLIVIPKNDCYEVLINGSYELTYYFNQRELWSIISSRFPMVNAVELFSNMYLDTPILINTDGVTKASLKFNRVGVNISLSDLNI